MRPIPASHNSFNATYVPWYWRYLTCVEEEKGSWANKSEKSTTNYRKKLKPPSTFTVIPNYGHHWTSSYQTILSIARIQK